MAEIKKFDTVEYMQMVRQVIGEGREVVVPIRGNSMLPFLIEGRDAVCLAPVSGRLRRGDIAAYVRDDGSFVCHRILRAGEDGYYFVGDGQTVADVEGPVHRTQVFAKAVRVRRKGRWASPTSFWWQFFAHAWLWLLPYRPALRRWHKRAWMRVHGRWHSQPPSH